MSADKHGSHVPRPRGLKPTVVLAIAILAALAGALATDMASDQHVAYAIVRIMDGGR